MNADFDQQLEARLSRELKALPDLTAPDSLATRVLARIEKRAARPWYRQSWQAWPAWLRAGSLAVLLAFFAGLYFAGSELLKTQNFRLATHKAGEWFSVLDLVWNTFTVLAGAAVQAASKLGPGFLIGLLAATALCYAACVGLGTLVVRFAIARR